MMKQISGGFYVKDLGTANAQPDPIAKCFRCGNYKTQSQLKERNKRFYCSNCLKEEK